ncbi:uncharacterized protein LOC120334027 isoform X2 [Styela clava]
MDESRKRKPSDENLSEGPDRPAKAGTSGENAQGALAVFEALQNIDEKALQSLPASSMKGANVTFVKQNLVVVNKGDQVTARNYISRSSDIKVVNQEGSTEADSKTDDPNQIPGDEDSDDSD